MNICHWDWGNVSIEYECMRERSCMDRLQHFKSCPLTCIWPCGIFHPFVVFLDSTNTYYFSLFSTGKACCKFEFKRNSHEAVLFDTTRAIRDAVSHAHFTINDTGNGYYEIHFKNFEQGYRFDRTFTQKELLYFYQDYDRLIAIQTLLLDSALIQDFLLREFKNWYGSVV